MGPCERSRDRCRCGNPLLPPPPPPSSDRVVKLFAFAGLDFGTFPISSSEFFGGSVLGVRWRRPCPPRLLMFLRLIPVPTSKLWCRFVSLDVAKLGMYPSVIPSSPWLLDILSIWCSTSWLTEYPLLLFLLRLAAANSILCWPGCKLRSSGCCTPLGSGMPLSLYVFSWSGVIFFFFSKEEFNHRWMSNGVLFQQWRLGVLWKEVVRRLRKRITCCGLGFLLATSQPDDQMAACIVI